MARMAANGAVVSDDGQWYHNGLKWSALVQGASGKPKIAESKVAAELATVASGSKGRKLAKLVVEHGSLEAAEAAVGAVEAGGLKQKIVTYKDRGEFEREAPRMMAAGWRVQGQNAENNHTTTGRVGTGMVVGGVLTGGVGALVGGALGAASKRKGSVQVVWERD